MGTPPLSWCPKERDRDPIAGTGRAAGKVRVSLDSLPRQPWSHGPGDCRHQAPIRALRAIRVLSFSILSQLEAFLASEIW